MITSVKTLPRQYYAHSRSEIVISQNRCFRGNKNAHAHMNSFGPTTQIRGASFEQKQCVLTLTALVLRTRMYLCSQPQPYRVNMEDTETTHWGLPISNRLQSLCGHHESYPRQKHALCSFLRLTICSKLVPELIFAATSVLCLFYTSACCTFLYQCTEVASHRDCDWDSLDSRIRN